MEAGDTPIHSQSQVCSCGNGVMEKSRAGCKEKHCLTSKCLVFFTSCEEAENGLACYVELFTGFLWTSSD